MKKLENYPILSVIVDILYLIGHIAIVVAALAALLGLSAFAEWFASII